MGEHLSLPVPLTHAYFGMLPVMWQASTKHCLLALVLLHAFVCSAHASGPRGWEAAHLADRQAPPLRLHQHPKRVPPPVPAPAPAASEAPEAALPLPSPPGHTQPDTGGKRVVSMHLSWLLALAAACFAGGYGVHAWQGVMQLPLGSLALPVTPGPTFSAASQKLRLRGRAAAAALEAAADATSAEECLSEERSVPRRADEGCFAAVCGARGEHDAVGGTELTEDTSAACSNRLGGEAGAVVTSDAQGSVAGPEAEDVRKLCTAGAAAAITGDALFADSSPVELRRRGVDGEDQSCCQFVTATPPALHALLPADAAAPEAARHKPEGPCQPGRVVYDAIAQGSAVSTSASPSADVRHCGWSESGAGEVPQRPPGADALWEDAAGLVANLAKRFGVAPGELAPGERVALIGVVLQTWHALQQDADAREAAWCVRYMFYNRCRSR